MLVHGDSISEVNRILSALRASLDVTSYPAALAAERLDELREIYLRFEDMRFAFRAKTSRMKRFGTYSDYGAVDELHRSLSDLLTTDRLNYFMDVARFRPLNMARPSTAFTIHPGFNEPRLSALEAVRFLVEALQSLPRQQELFPEDSQVDVATRLRQIIPSRQDVAPVQFDIDNDKIYISRQPGCPEEGDKNNISSASVELLRQSENIIDNLSRSNCDARLLETAKSLHAQILSGNDIIALGLNNIACGLMATKFENEIPDAIAAMLTAQNMGISMYVAQFPEWQRFTERAAMTRITVQDAPVLRAALTEISSHFQDKPHLADPEVPITLVALRELISDPSTTTKHAVFAVWRSVENLLIKIFNFSVDVFSQTAKKTGEKFSKTASTVIVAALMSAALAGAATLSPIAGKVPESAWIARAVEIVKEQIK